ncbi:3-deoxy-D-manno-octulosonic acid transferase [Alkalilimnicola ehrlichii]|uniref:3-deoxy-D-manno-octulosonic acid transferase n=1 Tax=Alkalilimnicola ehrlichii TaxID=351052 RepID=A0A3E0WSZ4_9GAMM|nr:DUF3800 domain-containing protein [Alkalilimnicola ehrlichii]RFA25785.1 3-deoxy-D-manno-octulosonic acid transferase [Alkalilimnicola ehrlichii]RFA35115.1 3-deoxy-D-manno-octulosonic acid transferase [Alkalilimnicola ehrlichii]
MLNFGDYIVYVDESGDHGLTSINPDYPVFVLAFCLFEKRVYVEQIVPRIQALKFRYFGHDMVVFHEADIRRSRPPFDILLNPTVREPFLADLTGLVESAPFTLVASCIMKESFKQRHGADGNPYHVAMEFGLERIYLELQSRGQRGRRTHVVFEQRGLQEDRALELEFRRIMDRSRMAGMADTLELVLADKKVNSAGLQLADMVARPIGRRLLRPDQQNRAYETLESKFRRDGLGRIEGWGLKCYP